MAMYNVSGELVTDYISKQNADVLVASSEAPSEIKSYAEYVCTGTNDELIIQQAITDVCNKGGGRVRLSEGHFYIGSFPLTDDGDDHVALLIPQKSTRYSIEIIGAGLPHGAKTASVTETGTWVEVTESAYEACSSSNKYTVLRAGYVASLMNTPSTVQLTIQDLGIRVPANQKKIMCIDLLYVTKVLAQRIELRAYKVGYAELVSGAIPPVAVDGCVGLRSMGGSNYGTLADYRNICAMGFREAFQMGSEHVVGINLAGVWNYYSFTFGNYPWQANFTHPITLINCCDERSVNLPLFADNGNKSSYSSTSTGGKQAITIIDFNIERDANQTPGGVLGNNATESTPGKFRGSIEYTMTYGSGTNYNINSVNQPFWADGSGHAMVSRNQAHELSGTSATRRSYAPNYMQAFYDTTVGKMLWCIDTANKTWVDADGNTVA